MKNSALLLFGFIAISQLAGVVGSVFTISAISDWYVYLAKPDFSPPSWVFAPVWTILYTLMGVAAWVVYKSKAKRTIKNPALQIFFIQLVLNAVWSIIFFGMKNPLLAFFELLLLWTTIQITMLKFYAVSKKASYVLIPYYAWVTFAAVLNYAIVILN